jgi:NitT/TauT family transport system ATP-binding protein
LLNVIAGFLPPSKGSVLIEGAPVVEPDPQRIFVFQENSVFPWLTVAENIAFGLAGLARGARERIVARYVDMVGLRGFENAYPRELSGGMRQRVEIARALAVDPRIIYLDEPFAALDFITRLKLRGDLTEIWESEKKTVVFVTHDIEEAIQLADRRDRRSRHASSPRHLVSPLCRVSRSDLRDDGHEPARRRTPSDTEQSVGFRCGSDPADGKRSGYVIVQGVLR